MNKFIRKTLFGIAAFIFFCRVSLKPMVESENQSPKNVTVHERVLPSAELINILVKRSGPTLKEFQSKLVSMVEKHEKTLQTLEEAARIDRDFFEFKLKNNLFKSNLADMSKLETSLYLNYEKRISDKLLESTKYYKQYLTQKEMIYDLVKQISLDQRESFSNFLVDFKSTARSKYSDKFSSRLIDEINQLDQELSNEFL